jgi:hypothetical protein
LRIDASLPLIAALGIAALLAAGLALATGAAPLVSKQVLGGAALAAAAAFLHHKLNALRALFIFTDYVHAEKN